MSLKKPIGIDKEVIIQKCYGIQHWAVERGNAKLNQEENAFVRYDTILNNLVNKLVEYIKNESS